MEKDTDNKKENENDIDNCNAQSGSMTMKMTMTTMMLPRKTITTYTKSELGSKKSRHNFQFAGETQEIDFSPHWKSKEPLPNTKSTVFAGLKFAIIDPYGRFQK